MFSPMAPIWTPARRWDAGRKPCRCSGAAGFRALKQAGFEKSPRKVWWVHDFTSNSMDLTRKHGASRDWDVTTNNSFFTWQTWGFSKLNVAVLSLEHIRTYKTRGFEGFEQAILHFANEEFGFYWQDLARMGMPIWFHRLSPPWKQWAFCHGEFKNRHR